MENLGNDVVETVTDVVTSEACTISKVSRVVLPVAAVLGLGLLVVTMLKRRKAKKAAATETNEEVNPEN